MELGDKLVQVVQAFCSPMSELRLNLIKLKHFYHFPTKNDEISTVSCKMVEMLIKN